MTFIAQYWFTLRCLQIFNSTNLLSHFRQLAHLTIYRQICLPERLTCKSNSVRYDTCQRRWGPIRLVCEPCTVGSRRQSKFRQRGRRGRWKRWEAAVAGKNRWHHTSWMLVDKRFGLNVCRPGDIIDFDSLLSHHPSMGPFWNSNGWWRRLLSSHNLLVAKWFLLFACPYVVSGSQITGCSPRIWLMTMMYASPRLWSQIPWEIENIRHVILVEVYG